MDNYYSQQIYQNTNQIIENQETTNQLLTDIKTNTSTLITFIVAITIILCANVIHHIIDAGWKKY